MQALHAARVALSLVGADAPTQARVLLAVERRLDRNEAMTRRDHWLRHAHALIGGQPGDVQVLADALKSYTASVWPLHRHLAEPPPDATPLRQALFRVCQAADDAGGKVPGYRQVRRRVE